MTWDEFYALPVNERTAISARLREECIRKVSETKSSRMRAPDWPARESLAKKLHEATKYEFPEDKEAWGELTEWDRDEYREMIDHILSDPAEVLAAIAFRLDQDSPTTT